ncbi:hypothetical protein KKG46_05600 [Patescibacteria group bacterium]|nr:hypothetical protein [Patescibacteria group bacterium]
MMENIANQERKEFKLFCPERMDVAEKAVYDLAQSLAILGVRGWTLPNIKEKFVESDEAELELGKTGIVTEIDAEVVFDERFRAKEIQEEYERELRSRGIDYPGMEQVFKHELAHLAMWSVTGLRHQAAIRLIDEGWAAMVERLGTEETPSLIELIKTIKAEILSLKEEQSDIYDRCMDLEHPVSHLKKEELKSAEYIVGAALLLWIREAKGQDAMIDLMRKSPSTSRRTSTKAAKVPADLKPGLHAGYQLYQKGVVDVLRKGSLSAEEMRQVSEFAHKWEAAQFRAALLEVTGFSSVSEAEGEFEKWLNS